MFTYYAGLKHVGKVNQMMKKFQAAISTLVEERVDPRLMSWALMELQFWLVKKEEYSERYMTLQNVIS